MHFITQGVGQYMQVVNRQGVMGYLGFGAQGDGALFCDVDFIHGKGLGRHRVAGHGLVVLIVYDDAVFYGVPAGIVIVLDPGILAVRDDVVFKPEVPIGVGRPDPALGGAENKGVGNAVAALWSVPRGLPEHHAVSHIIEDAMIRHDPVAMGYDTHLQMGGVFVADKQALLDPQIGFCFIEPGDREVAGVGIKIPRKLEAPNRDMTFIDEKGDHKVIVLARYFPFS